MSDYVRQVGDPIEDADGQPDVFVGVDHDRVTIHVGAWMSADIISLDAAQAEDFAALFVRATWEAGRNAERLGIGASGMAAMSDDAAAVPGRCPDPDCDGDAGHDGPHFQWTPE